MATVKTRINVSVSKRTKDALKALAKRDQKPVASKAADLIEQALELDEDHTLSTIADERLKGKVRWINDSEGLWR